jgi:hypothetical protein
MFERKIDLVTKIKNKTLVLSFLILVASLLALVVFNTQSAAAISNCSSVPSDKGMATTNVNIDSAGTYVIWSRIKPSSTSNDSYILKVDNQCATVGNGGLTANQWQWVNYESGQTGSVIKLNLTAGSHSVSMAGNEDNVGLDRVLFLSDTSCTPTDKGDNCVPSDTTAPTISITYPGSANTVQAVTTVTVSISNINDVSKVDLLVDGTVVATSNAAPYSVAWDTTQHSNASHNIKVKVTDPSGNTNESSQISVTVNNSSQTGIPTRIEAERYNTGGEGVGYHDTTPGNIGNGTCRSDDVDMKNTTDSGGGCAIGNVQPGEWLKYDVTIAEGGVYNFSARVAYGGSGDGHTFHLEVDGNDVTGPIAVPYTGGWESFSNIFKGNVNLPSGDHSLRVYFDDFLDLNWFEFNGAGSITLKSSGTDTTPPSQPSNFKTTNVGTNNVTLSWGTSTDAGSGVDVYKIYRNGSLLNSTSQASYNDTAVSPSTSYTYQVSAIDKASNESAKSQLTATTLGNISSCLDADIDQNGVVEILDAVGVIIKLGATGTAAGRADVDQNGVVEILDAVEVIINLNQVSQCN